MVRKEWGVVSEGVVSDECITFQFSSERSSMQVDQAFQNYQSSAKSNRSPILVSLWNICSVIFAKNVIFNCQDPNAAPPNISISIININSHKHIHKRVALILCDEFLVSSASITDNFINISKQIFSLKYQNWCCWGKAGDFR